MPGIVVFGRRWSVGSDDIVVPALLLVFLHAIWYCTCIMHAYFVLLVVIILLNIAVNFVYASLN